MKVIFLNCFIISLQDINIISRTVKENSPSVFISDFITLDADKSHTHNYTLVSNPSNTFEIINNGLYSSKTAVLNYEAKQNWVRCCGLDVLSILIVDAKGLWVP